MGFDDLSNSKVVLNLGLSLESSYGCKSMADPSSSSNHHRTVDDGRRPSLTLSLFGGGGGDNRLEPQISSADVISAASNSLSNGGGGGSVKREREFRSSDGEDDEDDDGSNGRKKLRLNKSQSALLEESFKQHTTLNPNQKMELARKLNLRPRQVEVWFQNRRARNKLKQTEVDCEFLKKCCETLTEENRRLQKEVQELKAYKLAAQPPMYMQIPAATLSLCPSCGGGGASVADGGSAKVGRFVAGKTTAQFYQPFTNSSAACLSNY